MEKWKEVKNFEDYYEVSNQGRVRRKQSQVNTGIKHNEKRIVKERILKPKETKRGYLSLELSKNGKTKTILVHRMVAEAFCEKENEEANQVNHKNCNKKDNRAENLEWTTDRENKNHGIQNNLYESKRKISVRCKQLNKIFDSSYSAAEYINSKYYGNSKQVKNVAAKIRAACSGIQANAYGFTWEHYK